MEKHFFSLCQDSWVFFCFCWNIEQEVDKAAKMFYIQSREGMYLLLGFLSEQGKMYVYERVKPDRH